MNDANYALLNYLTDVHKIKDITHEGVEKAIDLIFNFNDLLPQEQHLFNSIMLQAIDFEWVSEQLNYYALQEEMKKVEAYKEDHYDSH
jgi:hypothetical protein